MEYIQIEGPDGQIYEFPADMPEAEIKAVMAKQFPPDYEATGVMDQLAGMGEQVVAGINRGAVGMAALPKSLADLGALGAEKAGFISPETAQSVYRTAEGMNYENLLKAWEGFAGKLPEPDTTPERYVSTAAEFIPGFARAAAVKAPGVLSKVASAAQDLGRSVLAGVASEGAGQGVEAMGFDGTGWETLARIIGAGAGISAGGAAEKLFTKTPEQKAASELTLTSKELKRQKNTQYKSVMDQPTDVNLLDTAAIKLLDEVENFGPGPAATQVKRVVDKANKAHINTAPPKLEEIDNIRHNANTIKMDPNADSLQKELAKRLVDELDKVIGKTPAVERARELGQRYILEKDLKEVGRQAGFKTDPAGFVSKEAEKMLVKDTALPKGLMESLNRLRESGAGWSPYMSHSMYALVNSPMLAFGSYLTEKMSKGSKQRITKRLLQESLDIARGGKRVTPEAIKRASKKHRRVKGQPLAAVGAQGFMEDAEGNVYDKNGNLISQP